MMMVHDQANELRQLVRHRAADAPRAAAVPLIVVAGGKRSVGVTTTATNLAVALARRGRRAVLVEADLEHGGNADSELAPTRGTIVDVLSGRRHVQQVLERGPCGIQVLPGAWPAGQAGDCSAAAEDRLLNELHGLAPQAEVAVIDAGSSRGDLARRLWQTADAVLVVSTPEPAAIMESYAAIKVLLSPPAAALIYTLINRAADAAAATAGDARLHDACRRFLDLKLLSAGQVPRCDLSAAGDAANIFPARGTSARALDRAADTLWARLEQPRVTRSPSAHAAPRLSLAG